MTLSPCPAAALATRRAAIAAALAEHASETDHMNDPAFMDGFVSLSFAVEANGGGEASLAFAAAEGDDTSTTIARVMLAERAYRSGLPADPPVAYGARLEFVCALLEAASSSDDEVVVRWLASPQVGLDIAQVRRAQLDSVSGSLRAGIAQSLNSFRGSAARERATHAARALRSVAKYVERADASLARAVLTASEASASLSSEPSGEDVDTWKAAAASMDAVWTACGRMPDTRERVRLFCDAMRRTHANTQSWPISRIAFIPIATASRTGAALDEAACPPEETSVDDWDWPAAEPARLVVAPPMTFSASRLNAFVKCGRRWFYEYLCDAVEDRGSIHATYGRVVHEALEALHRDVRDPASVEGRAILDRFLFELDTAFGKARPDFASQFEYEVSRLQARRIAPVYVKWLVKQTAESPMEIAEVESVNRLRVGGHEFVGFIDRVDRPYGGGPVTIFDYKTGRVPDDPRAYLESVRTGDEAQLALYYFMRRARGDSVAKIALISVRDARDDVRVLALDIVEDGAPQPPARSGAIACSRAVLDESLAALVRRCDVLIREGVAHFDVSADPPCRFCVYSPSCRERPVETERIFAR